MEKHQKLRKEVFLDQLARMTELPIYPAEVTEQIVKLTREMKKSPASFTSCPRCVLAAPPR